MAFAEFQSCCQQRGLQDVSTLEQVGQDTVAWVIQTWNSTPTWAKTALEYAGAELSEAALALGWEALAISVLAVISAGGIAVGIDILQTCYPQW
jgi:hypothetical protein